MSVLRVYDPPECDERGDPLDWECCREFTGLPEHLEFHSRCERCEGHGSLKAAALADCAMRQAGGLRPDPPGGIRCESCNHPMSKGTWEGESISIRWALEHLRAQREPPTKREYGIPCPPGVHYSPCDGRCDHGGLVRVHNPDQLPDAPYWSDALEFETAVRHNVEAGMEVEASWRQVDIRRMGWPHDLRPEKLAILCTRCYAERTPHD